MARIESKISHNIFQILENNVDAFLTENNVDAFFYTR
jgi:hypothetical protein